MFSNVLQILNDNTSTLILLISVLIYIVLYNEYSLPRKLPPGPFRIPIVGHLPFLGNLKFLTLTTIGKKYGSVYRLFLGNRLVIVLNDYRAIKEAFLVNAEVFSGRPREEFIIAFPGNENVAGTDGPVWRDQRRFALGLMRDCGVGKVVIEPRIMEEIHYLISHLKMLKGRATDITDLLITSVANNISMIILGKKFEYTDPAFLNIKKILRIIPVTNSSLVAYNFIPWLKYIPGHSWFFPQHNVKLMAKEVDDFIATIANEHKSKFVEGQRDDYPKAFLTERTIRLKKNPNDTVFNDTALATNMRVIMNAGTGTTTTTLVWGLIYMMLYPTIQKRVQEELDAVFGNDRNASWSERHLTPYTMATLYEIQRMANIVPVNLPHRCKEECEILGYKIPKDTFIVSNLSNVLHDPKLWKDPNIFRPERFLTANGTVEKPEYFIPFSIGKRQCMGEILARMELYLYFTTLLQQFTFKTPEGRKPDLDYIVGTVRVPKNFETCAIPRSTTII